MPYDYESAEIPLSVGIRPTYDNAATDAAITAVPSTFQYAKRLKKTTAAYDAQIFVTVNVEVDLFSNAKQVTIGGTTLTYRQVAQFLKKIGDTERAALT